jgi:hypothetical protein
MRGHANQSELIIVRKSRWELVIKVGNKSWLVLVVIRFITEPWETRKLSCKLIHVPVLCTSRQSVNGISTFLANAFRHRVCYSTKCWILPNRRLILVWYLQGIESYIRKLSKTDKESDIVKAALGKFSARLIVEVNVVFIFTSFNCIQAKWIVHTSHFRPYHFIHNARLSWHGALSCKSVSNDA